MTKLTMVILSMVVSPAADIWSTPALSSRAWRRAAASSRLRSASDGMVVCKWMLLRQPEQRW
jgi:hypothetical protein